MHEKKVEERLNSIENAVSICYLFVSVDIVILYCVYRYDLELWLKILMFGTFHTSIGWVSGLCCSLVNFVYNMLQ